jgi:DNA-binding response OmpR family regulator
LTEYSLRYQSNNKEVRKMKPILIAEDETILRESLRDWLTDNGYQVETAGDGEEALKTIAEQDFGLAILDLKLPGKDGIQVLREAKEKSPQLKGIIITAFPSVQTAVEAVKEGAIDYLPKPFELDDLEKSIKETLGPVQVELRPKAVTEEVITKPPAVEKPEVEEVVTITREEIPVHLKQGKAYFEAGQYQEALKEFQAVLAVAPGSIETRVWIRKTNEALAKPEVEVVAEEGEAALPEEVKPKYCVWMKLGLVAYRICTNNYDCLSCEFDQMMQEKMASGETPELDAALERFKALPGNQRLCRYAIKGDVSYRLCTRLFRCATCEFGQMMDDATQQKLAKLSVRREALLRKEQRAGAKTEPNI